MEGTLARRLAPVILALLLSCGGVKAHVAIQRETVPPLTDTWLQDHYGKQDAYIKMRDGVRLHTAVYAPSDSLRHPVIMIRTPYGLGSTGEKLPGSLRTWMRMFALNRYIIVFQSVRGTFLSEGTYENIRPLKPEGAHWLETDEATDTFDTVEWLLANTRTNGSVGVKGVSYPGFYAMLAGLSGHPAIKAVSPQAPVTDWWRGDDFHHNGVWMLDMYTFASSFFRVRQGPSEKGPESLVKIDRDIYSYYRQFPDFQSLTANFGERIPFWEEMMQHPDYDDWWAERNVADRLYGVKPAVLVVGGNYDAEDCFGAIETYAALRHQSPETDAFFVYGPWSHGGWRDSKYTGLGDSRFGYGSTDYFVEEIEYPFFAYYLEGKGTKPIRVHVLPSRAMEEGARHDTRPDWRTYDDWPVSGLEEWRYHLDGKVLLGPSGAPKKRRSRSYVSDPENPVPYMEKLTNGRNKNYMAADQRFAEARKDVLTYWGNPLREDLLAEGPVRVHLEVSLSTTDADFIVKLIDERPDGYQMLVRGDVFRARYRNSLRDPEPVEPGKKTPVEFTLNDIAHLFQKGHRIVVQVQSSWYPLMAVSPQFFQENPYTVPAADYRTCRVTVWNDSWISLPVAAVGE